MANAVNILNGLLALEYQSLISRLEEINLFVALPAAEDQRAVQQLVADAKMHERDLTDLIMDLRGAPLPPRYSARTSSAHYVGIEYLMPMILENLKKLIAAYTSVGPTGASVADKLINRNLENYRKHLVALEKAHANLLAAQ